MSKKTNETPRTPVDLANQLEAEERQQDAIAASQKSNKQSMLDVVEEQLTKLTKNEELKAQLENDFDVVKEEIGNMNKGLENLEKSENLSRDDKIAKKADVMQDTVETLSTLNEAVLQNKDLEKTLSAADAAIKQEIQDKNIEIPKPLPIPEKPKPQEKPEISTEEKLKSAKDAIGTAQEVVNSLKSDPELKNNLGSKNHDRINKIANNMNKDLEMLDKLHEQGKLPEEALITNKQGRINSAIDQINGHLDKFDKALDKQQGVSNFDKVKNVLKAAAKVVITLGSKEAKMELAAAQFKRQEKAMSGKYVEVDGQGRDKTDKFKDSKQAVADKLQDAKPKGFSR